MILLTLGAALYYGHLREQSMKDYAVTLTQIEEWIGKDRFAEAWLIIKDLDPGQDPRRSEFFDRIVVPGALSVANAGVNVSFRPYGRDDIDWIPLGATPFEEPVALPRGELHFKLELAGHDRRELVAKNPGPLLGNELYFKTMGFNLETAPIRLYPDGEITSGFVDVPASNLPISVTGWSRHIFALDVREETSRFLVAKQEVTNLEYKAFIDAGGYSSPAFWEGLLLSDGDQPFTGVSWFEAAAYARFRSLSLPTIYQWARFALGPAEGLYPLASAIEIRSNFSRERLVAATAPVALGPWGTYNTAGNVREWTWNNTTGSVGIIQGSQWRSYGNYPQLITAPRGDRDEGNGIRLVQNLPGEEFHESQLAPIDIVYDDPQMNREPVSDDAWNIMRLQF